MREVAKESEVKLSLIVYHFETKLRLYTEIFARRQYINDRRLKMLNAIQDHSEKTSLPMIIEALVEPSLTLHEDPQGHFFAQLVLRETADPSNIERPIMEKFFDPLAIAFISAFRHCLPSRPEGFHEWAYMFTIGALTQSVFDVRATRLGAEPECRKNEFLKEYILFGMLGST